MKLANHVNFAPKVTMYVKAKEDPGKDKPNLAASVLGIDIMTGKPNVRSGAVSACDPRAHPSLFRRSPLARSSWVER